MDNIKEIARRLYGLRDSLDLTAEQMADTCGVSQELYTMYESGESDIPVSFLIRAANTFGLELTTLFCGNEPKMLSYYVTRAGQGAKVERTAAYNYQDIAAGFSCRKMEPFMVTVDPSDQNKPMTINTHEGQELNYVLEGTMEINVEGHSVILNPGDSIMFDACRPHGMRTVGNDVVKFIAIIC